jgi:NADH-quinone oxidoreductase subunit C
MTSEQICQLLTAAGFQVAYKATTPDPHIEVPREVLSEVAKRLKSESQFAFDSLMCLSALDRIESLEVVYHLLSYKHRHRVTLKTRCPKDDPVVPSVASLWPTAEWHEREAFDLIGITFQGHPDLRRILLPEDWEGHPLRKDYQPPAKWHNIPLTPDPPKTKNE